MADHYHVGIIGLGSLGLDLARQFDTIEETTVRAIADIDPEIRSTVGEDLSVPERHRYADHLEMLESARLDIVGIATPHTIHHQQVMDALDKDLHVLCEKPLCTEVGNAKEIRDLVDRSGAELMIGYQRHLSPAFIRVRDRLDEWVGEPTFITAEITQNWLHYVQGTWRCDPELSGGGQLFDTGNHLLDALLWITRLKPTEVSARMVFEDEEQRIDTQAILNVTFETGTVASISVSGDVPRMTERIRIWGENGAVTLESREWSDHELSRIRPNGDLEKPLLRHEEAPTKAEKFLEVIKTEGKASPATAQDGYAVTALTAAAYQSARQGCPVRVHIDGE